MGMPYEVRIIAFRGLYDESKVVESKKRKHFETAGLDKVDKLEFVPGIGKSTLKKFKSKTNETKVDDLMGSTSGLMLLLLQLQDPGDSFELIQQEFYDLLIDKLGISERKNIHQIVSAISDKLKKHHLWLFRKK